MQLSMHIVQVQTVQNIESIYCELASRMRRGEWAVGEFLPREIDLAAHYNCGRHAVSQAIARLVYDGLVERRKKSGTRVLRLVQAPAKQEVELDAFAFIYPNERLEGVWRTMQGFQNAANEQRRPVVTLSTGIDYEKEVEFIRRLSEFNVLGGVIHPVLRNSQQATQFCQLLLGSKFPIVLVGVNLASVDCPVVITDGFDAGYRTTRHLLDRGLTRVGFFSDHARAMNMRDRYQGYRWALQEAGLPENEAWICRDASMHPNFEDPFSVPRKLAGEFLRSAHGMEGVVCAYDVLAVGMIQAAREIGKNVPADLKVTGIDGHGIAAREDISLTTYQVSSETAGRKAFEILEQMVAGIEVPVSEIQIKGELIVRSSSQ